MKNEISRLLRRASAAALAVLMLASGAPLQPFADAFSGIAITAHADDDDDFGDDGGDDGYDDPDEWNQQVNDGDVYDPDASTLTINSNPGSTYQNADVVSITIGKDVTEIDAHSFLHCYDVESFTVAEENPSFSSDNGCVYNKQGDVLILVPGATSGTFTLPASVTSFDPLLFYTCNFIEYFDVENGNTVYHDYEGIIVDNNNTAVRCPCAYEGTFTAYADSEITNIGNFCFENCALVETVDLSRCNVTDIGESAFGLCESLKTVYLSEVPTTIGDWAFIECFNLETITCDLTDNGQNDTIIYSVGEGAFSYCSSLNNLSFSRYSFDINIGTWAFGDSGLTEVAFEDAEIVNIEEYAFENTPLNTVFFNCDGIISLADNAFADTPQLKSVIFANNPQALNINTNSFGSSEDLTFYAFEEMPQFPDIYERLFMDYSGSNFAIFRVAYYRDTDYSADTSPDISLGGEGGLFTRVYVDTDNNCRDVYLFLIPDMPGVISTTPKGGRAVNDILLLPSNESLYHYENGDFGISVSVADDVTEFTVTTGEDIGDGPFYISVGDEMVSPFGLPSDLEEPTFVSADGTINPAVRLFTAEETVEVTPGGGEIHNTQTVLLTEGTDYTYNIELTEQGEGWSRYTVTVLGKGEYAGVRKRTFRVAGKTLDGCTAECPDIDVTKDETEFNYYSNLDPDGFHDHVAFYQAVYFANQPAQALKDNTFIHTEEKGGESVTEHYYGSGVRDFLSQLVVKDAQGNTLTKGVDYKLLTNNSPSYDYENKKIYTGGTFGLTIEGINKYFGTINTTVRFIPSVSETPFDGYEDVSWAIDNGVLSVFRTEGSTGTYEMPTFSENTDFPWFDYSSSITKAVIREGITSVSPYAFDSYHRSYNAFGSKYYNALEEVELADSVTTIGEYAFCGDDKLSKTDIPAEGGMIGDHAFEGCASLNVIDIQKRIVQNDPTLPTIGTDAFKDCPVGLLGSTVTVGSDIVMNYVFDAGNVDPSDIHIDLTWPKGEKSIDLSELTAETSGQYAGKYLIAVPFAAKELADKVTSVVTLCSTGLEPFEYSPIEYLTSLIRGYDVSSAELTDAVTALIYYGAAAQTLFDYNTEYLASDWVGYGAYTPPYVPNPEEIENAYNDLENYSAPDDYDALLANTNLTYAGSALKLRSRTIYSICFTKDDPSAEIPAIELKNGSSYTQLQAYDYEEDGVQYVCCDIAIPIDELLNDITLRIGGTEMDFNVKSYIALAKALTNAEDEPLKNAAMMLFYASATARLYNEAAGV